MTEEQYSYYDADFSIDQAYAGDLLLIIAEPFFSLAILESTTKKLMVWAQQLRLDQFDADQDIKNMLEAKYHDIKVAVESRTFTLIPNELFDSANLAAYTTLLGCREEDKAVISNFNADTCVAYKVVKNTAVFIERFFKLQQILFAGAGLLAALGTDHHHTPHLYAHTEGNHVQLVYFKAGKLQFYNLFEFNNADELMYYIVLTANELNLNLDETSLILSGDVTHSDKKLNGINDILAKVYFNQTNIIRMPAGFLPHQILMLAGLSLCGSLVEN